MKPWIKVLIGVVSGFAGGFAAGFFFHKKLNDIQFVEITEEEMKQISEDLDSSDKSKKSRDKSIEDVESKVSQATNEDELRNALQGKVKYANADDKSKERYSKAWESVKDYSDEENADSIPVDLEENMDEDFLEMLELEEVEPGQVTPPHIISLSEFYNERPEYDKITIEWYEPDNVYLDENEEIIADISTYVGELASKLFTENGPDDDPDICFVRNEKFGSDYEIIRHHLSYKEMIGEE